MTDEIICSLCTRTYALAWMYVKMKKMNGLRALRAPRRTTSRIFTFFRPVAAEYSLDELSLTLILIDGSRLLREIKNFIQTFRRLAFRHFTSIFIHITKKKEL